MGSEMCIRDSSGSRPRSTWRVASAGRCGSDRPIAVALTRATPHHPLAGCDQLVVVLSLAWSHGGGSTACSMRNRLAPSRHSCPTAFSCFPLGRYPWCLAIKKPASGAGRVMGLHKVDLISTRCMVFIFSSCFSARWLDDELILKSTFTYNTPSVVRLSSEDAPHCGGADKGRVMGITQAFAAP